MDKEKQREFHLIDKAIDKVWNTINSAPWNNNFKDLSKDEREFIHKKYEEAQRLNDESTKDYIEIHKIRREIRDRVKSNATVSPLEDLIDSILNLW